MLLAPAAKFFFSLHLCVFLLSSLWTTAGAFFVLLFNSAISGLTVVVRLLVDLVSPYFHENVTSRSAVDVCHLCVEQDKNLIDSRVSAPLVDN